jgi:hypothetical protein
MAQQQHTRPDHGQQTVERERYHLAEHVLDAVATLSRSMGLSLTRLDQRSLITVAKRRTGLENTGDDRFLEGLGRILSESTGRYTGFGDAVLRSLLVRALEVRLRSVEYSKRHPDVLEVPIDQPIIVLGLPRSGTTLLQRLLAASLDRAQLEFWELMSVAPINEADLEADKQRRIRELARMLRAAKLFVPELDRIHHATPTSPEEDWQLLVPSFQTLAFASAFGLEEYGRWLLSDADMVWAYREFKQRLQIILHQRPRQRLVLKCPDHLWFIDALTEVFPDAHIVQTHRDPVDCIASYASMVSLQERTLTGRIEWQPLAKRLTDLLLSGTRRAEEARSRHGDERFCDAPFDELERDPAAVVRRVAGHFALPAPSGPGIDRELAAVRADQAGSHRYSFGRLGLEPDAIRREFGWSGADPRPSSRYS